MPAVLTLVLHANAWHLAGNLLGLVVLAPRVARTIGWVRCIALALIAGEAANRFAAALIDRPVIGASAAVFALAGAWLAIFPHDRTARARVWLLVALQAAFAAVALDFGGVAWCAHLIGVALGWLTARTCSSA